MKLIQLETSFQQYLIHHDTTIFPEISFNETLSTEERLKIYFDAYRLRLLEILSSDYPKLSFLVGEEAFETMGHDYIAAYPSQGFSVRYFGKHFSKFLHEHLDYGQKPYLSELAAFEWALSASLDAANAPTINLDTLKSLTTAQFTELKLSFHPSLQRLEFCWNVPEIWKQIEEEPNAQIIPSLYSEKKSWIVYRQGIECYFRSQEAEEAFAMQQMMNQATVSEVCEALTNVMEDAKIPEFVLNCLHRWFAEGSDL